MSQGSSSYVWENSKASGNDLLVLLAIADEANDEGKNAFPSVRRIARKARCHTETVSECTKRLEALGELVVERPEKQGRGRYNRYTLIMAKRGVDSDPSDSAETRVSSTGSVLLGQRGSDPRQSDPQSAPKQTLIRALPVDKPSCPQPETRFRMGSVPESYEGCDDCDGGVIFQPDDSVVMCPCRVTA